MFLTDWVGHRALGATVPSAELIDALDGKEEMHTRETTLIGIHLILDGRGCKSRSI